PGPASRGWKRVPARHEHRHARVRRSDSPRRPRQPALSARPCHRPIAAVTRGRVPSGRCATMTLVTEAEPDWRPRHKPPTCDRIRACALRLFREQGYDATTVEQIAAAAGVSHMTFFRCFPTKEDVALSDNYDPLIASFTAQTPAAWPLIQRIRAPLVQGLR